MWSWQEWHAFEVAHGNQDTFKEMLRVKRSVVNQFALANIATQQLMEQAEKLAKQQKQIQEAAKASIEALAAQRTAGVAPPRPPPPPSAALDDAPSKKRGRPADIDFINAVRVTCSVASCVVIRCNCCCWMDRFSRGFITSMCPDDHQMLPSCHVLLALMVPIDDSVCHLVRHCFLPQAMATDEGKPKEEEAADVDLGDIQEAAVPAGVFGDALEALEREKRGESVGALGLFKRKKTAAADDS